MAIFHYNPERPFSDYPELYLMYWGKEDCEPNHSVGPGIRDIYKVHFIHKGTGIVRASGNSCTLTAGQAFLAFPNHVIYYRADEVDPWTYSWVGFRGVQADSILSRTALSPEQPVFPMDVRIMPNLYELLNEASQYEFNRDLRISALLLDFLSSLLEIVPASTSTLANYRSRDEYIHRGLEFLHSHYSENISIQQLASMLRLDRKYLSAIFKEATGLPPQQYLLAYRMERACELLKRGKYSVGEVARSVGYQDALLFSKMFKKFKGISPKQYR